MILAVAGAVAQSAADWMEWGDRAMARGDHYGASKFFGNALTLDDGRLDLQWKMAEACRLSNQYPQAAELYERVTKKDMGRTHPEAYRWWAEMLMCNGDYDAAQRAWNKVRQKAKDPGSFAAHRAINGLAGCDLARKLMAEPEKVGIEHLPRGVNTFDSEFGARIGPDSALYFSSLRGKLSDEGEVQDTGAYRVAIFRGAPMNGAWNDGVALGEAINSGGDNANAAWSSDGRHFYFTRCAGGSPCRILVSTAGGPPVPLAGMGEAVMSTQPMVVRMGDHDVLFFSSDREGGLGGSDIWMANIDGATASDARPLGEPVNTIGNEACPFYDAVQKKLYFSSDFHPGLGGYDNFMSEDKGGTFSEPENFKYPLNSPANDLYPTFDMATMSGFFTSNREGSFAAKGETCCNDLYRFSYKDLPEEPVDSVMEVAVKRITTLREKLPVRLYFHNDEPEPRSRDTITARTYEQTYRAYKALLPEYHDAWRGNTEGTRAIDGFFSAEVDAGFTQLNDFIALLKQAMEEGQRIKLVVRGFASPLAESDYNVHLSLRRIQSMINYLRSVDGGVFVPYLDGTATNGGRLTIEKAPYGEYRAVEGVSDVLADLQGSVYSVGASRERRIEIEQVEMMAEGTGPSGARAVLDRSTADLGTVPQGEPQEAWFVVRNTGTGPLRLLRTRTDCGCTTAAVDPLPILPGGHRIVVVDFDGKAPAGAMKRTVQVFTDGDPPILELTITGTVVAPK